MEVIELKFLLKLLGKQDYRAAITEIKPNSKTKASERDKICLSLRDRRLVDCLEEVTKLKIAPPGKELLKLDPSGLPVTDEELKALRASAKGTINPGDIKISAANRQVVIQKLVERGLVEAVKMKIKEVWLTKEGQEYLTYEYNPSGTGNTNLTQHQLGELLSFIRKKLLHLNRNAEREQVEEASSPIAMPKPQDEEILQTVMDLDRKLGTDNYLPIFHLREKLQPPLSRKELDQALYRLQRQDRIELSSLQEGMHYTSEQIDAAINQEFGGPLFFIIVN